MIATLLTAWALSAQSPDSVIRAGMMDAVTAMADSLAALRGAGAQFNRDLANASSLLVLTRARSVRARCAAATAAGAHLDSLYARHAAVIVRDAGVAGWRQELTRLQTELARCTREWTAAVGHSADSLRVWGPYRLARLEEAARRYREAAARLPYPKAKPAGSSRVGSARFVDSHFHIVWTDYPTPARATGYPPHATHIDVS